MYTKRIVLENIRGFEQLDFELERPDKSYAGWTVITGDNGSGKSALLKAVAVAVAGKPAAQVLQTSFKGWIRSERSQALIAVEIAIDPDDDKFTETGRTTVNSFWAELEFLMNGSAEPDFGPGRKYTRKGKTPVRGPWSDSPRGWFCCGYGPFRRLYGASSDAMRLMAGPSRIARFVSMFREDAALSECEGWLTNLHNRSRDGRKEDEAILTVVRQLLDDDFLQHGVRIERVDADGLWLRDSSGVVLPLKDMSDGYRAALAILTDILRHMVEVYGIDDLVAQQNGNWIVQRSGVVLIDEIDAHLHPAWQREIGFWLKRRFPKVQFLVTTHSPIVCQAADPMGIFRLPPPGSGESPCQLSPGDYEQVITSKPDTILLSPAFGLTHTRSPQAVAARRRHAQLMAAQRSRRLTLSEKEELGQTAMFTDEEE